MKTRTNALRVDKDGIFLAPSDQGSLCEYCGIQNQCEVRAAQLRRCPSFVPVLLFTAQALAGLSGRFSTFRASYIWYLRAKWIYDTHKRVAIYDGEQSKVIAFARITDVHTGPSQELLNGHAKTNHLVLAGKVSDADAPGWLLKKIKALAGSRYIKSEVQPSTVIYVSVEEKEPLSQAAG